MVYLPYLVVVSFFSLAGLSLVLGQMSGVRYWSFSDNVSYIAKITVIFICVGGVSGLGVIAYSVTESLGTFVAMVLMIFLPTYYFISPEIVPIDLESRTDDFLLSFERSIYQSVFGADSDKAIKGDREGGTSVKSDDSKDETSLNSDTILTVERLLRRWSVFFFALGLKSLISLIIMLPFILAIWFDVPLLYLPQLGIGVLLGLAQQSRIKHQWTGINHDDGGFEGDKKNVLLYVIDDVRRDHTSLYGYDRQTTPFLESIRDDSYVFSNAISPGTRSGHSIPALLSGAPATVHNYFANIGNLRLLPDEFGEKGYATGVVCGNPHMTSDEFINRFDWYMWSRRGTGYQFAIQRRITRVLARFSSYYIPVNYFIMDTGWMVNLAKGFLDEIKTQDQPFFLYVHPQDVHESYLRSWNKVTKFAAEHDQEIERGDWTSDYDFDERRALWYEDEVKNWGYDEAIRNTDKNLRRLCSYLEEEGMLSDTIIAVTSDHGELLGERGLWGHIDVPYNQAIEVPLLIYDPQQDGEEIDSIISGGALPSLIFDMAGITPTEQMRAQWITETTCPPSPENLTPSLVDFDSQNIALKGYKYSRLLPEGEGPINSQKLLVGKDWKCHEVNGEVRFHKYDDAFLDNTVQRNEVPSDIVDRFEREIERIERLAKKVDRNQNLYDEIDDPQVRQQLDDLGYL